MTENEASTPSDVSRRTMVKAIAWSAPVIAVAVGAPAVAASPAQATLQFLNFSMWASVAGATVQTVEGNLGIQLAYQAPTVQVTQVTVVISLSAPGLATGPGTIKTGSSATWTAVSGVANGGAMDYTFRWTGSIDTSPTPGIQLNFSLPLASTNIADFPLPIAVTAVATAPNATTATANATVTARDAG